MIDYVYIMFMIKGSNFFDVLQCRHIKIGVCCQVPFIVCVEPWCKYVLLYYHLYHFRMKLVTQLVKLVNVNYFNRSDSVKP